MTACRRRLRHLFYPLLHAGVNMLPRDFQDKSIRFNWTERRIRAHVFLCVIALQVERWMRNKLQPILLSVPRTLYAGNGAGKRKAVTEIFSIAA
jgi:hypothetical protein